MTRLLHVLPSLSHTYGGPVRCVTEIASRLLLLGIESEIAGFGPVDLPDNPFDERRIHSFPISAPHKYCYSPQFRTWLRSNLRSFDGVVLHGLWIYPNWAAAQECKAQGIGYGCFPHGMLEPWLAYGLQPWKILQKAVCWTLRERRILQDARCLFFTTYRERNIVHKNFHLSGNNRILAPYGVEAPRSRIPFPRSPELAVPKDWRVALFLGRLHPKKNISLLIQAWKTAGPPDSWHLIIAGSGDEHYESNLRKSVMDLGLDGHVHFTGFVSGQDKSYLLQRADWFLLPSLRENFGVAVTEAIGQGCPVAISDQVYIAESLHPRSEILPCELRAWVSFMRQRMVDDAWRNTLIQLDRDYVSRKLSMEAVTREWAEALYSAFGSTGCEVS